MTKVSFRRDVRFFLAILTGFLVVLILILLILLQNAVLQTEATMRAQRETAADIAAATINRLSSPSGEEIRSNLAILRGRFGLATAAVESPQRTVRVGYEGEGIDRVTRATSAGTLTLGFDAAPIASLRRRFFLTAIITVAAVIAGTVLLLLYAPKITKPIEELLDEAASVEDQDPDVDEHQYLVDTFRKTIATMRTQEEELRRLHDHEKTRADDFERVAAALTRSLTSGFIAVDPDGRVVDVNDSGRDILRLPRNKEVIGHSLSAIDAPPHFAEVLGDAAKTRLSMTRHEIDSRTRTGERLVIGLSTVPLLNEGGVFLGMVALFTDLTPIRDLEGRMRDMQTLADLGEMSAGIAHEFRNSLSTILGYLKLAQKQTETEAMRDKMKKAEEEATLLSAAITSLLNFTRPFTVELQRVDLRELVDSIVGRLEPQADGIEIMIDGHAEIEGDRSLLARAIENVLRNAIDAIRSKGNSGRIDVQLRSDPPSIAVRDNGAGLADAQTSRSAFVPFQSQKPGGFGLGLPLAKKIALLHGGTVSLEAHPEGGVVATIEFARSGVQESAPLTPEVLR